MSKAAKVELFPLVDGVLVLLPPDLAYTQAVARFDEKLRRRPKDFRGTTVVIDVASRALTTAQVLALEALIRRRLGVRVLQIVNYEADEVLADDGLHPADRQRLAALSWSRPLSVSKDAQQETTVVLVEEEESPRSAPVKVAPMAAPAEDLKGDGAARPPGGGLWTVLLRRTIRSGQRIAFEGNVVIVGDVNPGAEIVAGGDVIVVGTLRGLAHAGAQGNGKAIVAALALRPTQLRIGPTLGRSPDRQPALPGGPAAPLEVARLEQNQIVVEKGLRRDTTWAGLLS